MRRVLLCHGPHQLQVLQDQTFNTTQRFILKHVERINLTEGHPTLSKNSPTFKLLVFTVSGFKHQALKLQAAT